MNSPNTPPLSTSSSAPDHARVETKSLGIYFLGLPALAREAASQAVQLAFPNDQVRSVNSSAEIGAENCERCLVVLGDAEAAATLIAESGGSPRCAVVVLSNDISDVAETVPSEEWNPPLLARVFRSALLEQELLRENVRLRGDLKTVARRVSHDLRTPLGCIYTTSGVFKELPAGDQESILAMAGIIKESASEISQIVDRVSFVLKASADPIAPSRVDMGGVVATVLTQLTADLQKADARVTLPSSWPETAGVTTWLQVIWSNLLRNAFQHGGPSASILVAWEPYKAGYRFSITNRGTGIPDARTTGFFSPFDQLHVLHVSGLGLSFVQRLVSLQGGECGYTGSPEGSTFFFTLPAAR